MSEMLDRVAKAIYERDYGTGPTLKPWPELFTEEVWHYRELARAAIEAMREASDDQRNAYYKLSGNIDVMMDAHWERAIDAALA